MNILCLNTAFSEAQIAVEYNSKSYFEKLDSDCKHSENLLIAVEKVFDKIIQTEKLTINSNKILKNIDYISVVIGPGSFTGIRIATASAKAILLTNSRMKAIGINTLELIGYEFISKNKVKEKITPVIDALSGLYFVAEFNKNLELITAPKMIEEATLKNYNFLISNDESISKNFISLSPENLLSLTKKKISENKITSENELIPLYIRPSQAEAELCKKSKN